MRVWGVGKFSMVWSNIQAPTSLSSHIILESHGLQGMEYGPSPGGHGREEDAMCTD